MAPVTVPIVDHLELDGDRPHLSARRCQACGARFVDRRVACARCAGTAFDEVRLADTGTLRAFTIVHRARAVPVPYVSALVELDDGFVVKANLKNVAPELAAVRLHMPVRLVTFVAGEDGNGTRAIAYGYEPTTSTDRPEER